MGSLKLYKSYNFVDKDPIIDQIRNVVNDSGETYTRVHELSGVSETTLYNWFNGKTKRPHFATVQAVARALGKNLVLVDIKNAKIIPIRKTGTRR